MFVCSSAEKPLILFHLVHTHDVVNALVFTKSAESTARLVKLFEFFEAALRMERGGAPVVARAYSSDLSPNERKLILEQFKNQDIHMYVGHPLSVIRNRRLTQACVDWCARTSSRAAST